jgi:GNAT superfamily N-acetyltransferase
MLRAARPQDARFLRDMVRHAYHWRLAQDPDLPVASYVNNWGRAGDTGLLAFEGINVFGAAWYRLFSPDEPGFGFVDERTPELTVAVVPSHRGRGTGAELLGALLGRARQEGHRQVSLSAQVGSTGLYERFGFRPVGEAGGAVTMVAQLESDATPERER